MTAIESVKEAPQLTVFEALSVILIWIVGNDPETLGVPDSTPVDVFRVMPVGREPVSEKVYGVVPPEPDGVAPV